MKTIEIPDEGVLVEYGCATCKRWHRKPEEAARCYAVGEGKQIVPSGSIIALNGNDDMCFVVSSFHRQPNEHRGGYRLWGFRDTQAGDNAEDEFCGDDLMHVEYVVAGQTNELYYPLPESDQWLRDIAEQNYKVNTDIPAFKRAVKFAKAMELKPQYWDGKKFVPVK